MLSPIPRLTAAELHRLARSTEAEADAWLTANGGCPVCAALICPGWESLPGGFDASVLKTVATLRDADPYAEPTRAEHHPYGTRSDSSDAPIATCFHPYNRCDVARCRRCRRGFLRYTETGGYYSDVRIRELRAGLIVGSGGRPNASCEAVEGPPVP